MNIICNADKNVKHVDFLFVYEIKTREFESICLLTQELENRGYSVGIVDWWNPLVDDSTEKLSTKVLITAAVYKTESLQKILGYIKGKAKVVNMQWEQLYCVKDLTNPNSPWRITGEALNTIYFSWGNENRKKLLKDGVSKDKIKLTGNVTLDFLRPEFRDYYFSKEQILEQYHLDDKKQICLFISSFSWVKMPESMVDPELKEFMEISIESQKAILSWITQMLSSRDDIYFIYRPHPAEADNEDLFLIAKQYSNFKVIRDYSVKQWILVSDIIYNWYSTSMAEIYFAGKSCFILRPLKISEELELADFVGGSFITKYEEFVETFNKKENNLPVQEQLILDNYYVDLNEATYLKIADALEEVYHGDYGYFCHYKWNRH